MSYGKQISTGNSPVMICLRAVKSFLILSSKKDVEYTFSKNEVNVNNKIYLHSSLTSKDGAVTVKRVSIPIH